MKVVKVLEAIEVLSAAMGKPQQRRVAILQRDDGHFSFAEQYFYANEWEGKIVAEGWAQHPPEGIFASAEEAEAEGQSCILKRQRSPKGAKAGGR